MKTCSKCKIEKDFDKFTPSYITTDGFLYQCKECDNSYKKEWKKNNPEKVKISLKKYEKKRKERKTWQVKQHLEH